MEIAFESKQLREICEDEDKAKYEFGVSVTEKLMGRLADLRAATSVKDLVAGWPRELGDSQDRHFAVDLCEGYSIVFCSNHITVLEIDSGKVNWSKVSRVKILEIEKDHG